MSLLSISNLVAGYGDFQALFGVSLSVEEGKIVAIIGSNGAGKTTLLKTITGLLHPQQATDVQFDGNPIGSYEPETIVKLGIAMVPEGRVAHSRPSTSKTTSVWEAIAAARAHGRSIGPGRTTLCHVADAFWWPATNAGHRPGAYRQSKLYFVTSSVLDLHRLSFATFTQPCLGSGLKGRQS